MTRRVSRFTRCALVAVLAVVAAPPRPGHATPSTNFWAPSTPFVQPYRVLHVTYDSYFGTKGAYPIDTGLTLGVLPWKGFQSEVGFDLFYPSVASGGPIVTPIVLNAKVGAPEDTYFNGQPAWSVGVFGIGFEEGFNDQNVLHAMLGKTLPAIGAVSLGGYYALNGDLFRSSEGGRQRSGLMAGWLSPAIDVPKIDKIALVWDIQTGRNALGATGGGVCVNVTPTVGLLLGPVFFFDRDIQAGGSSWFWSVQLDVDLDLAGK